MTRKKELTYADPNQTFGRPRKPFDWEQFEKLCALHCTQVEICGFFGISDDTLCKRVKERTGMTFEEYFPIASSDGKISLRRAQWKSAMDGNVNMQRHLGEQILGQTNKREFVMAEASLRNLTLSYAIEDPPHIVVDPEDVKSDE